MITITFQVASHEEAAALMAKVRAASPQAAGGAKVKGTEEKPKRGRKPKEEVEEEEIEEDFQDDDSDDSDSESDEDFTEESEDEDESDFIEGEQLSKVKKALKAYSDKNGKQKAFIALSKFAKTSAEVKKEDFARIIKALKV